MLAINIINHYYYWTNLNQSYSDIVDDVTADNNDDEGSMCRMPFSLLHWHLPRSLVSIWYFCLCTSMCIDRHVYWYRLMLYLHPIPIHGVTLCHSANSFQYDAILLIIAILAQEWGREREKSQVSYHVYQSLAPHVELMSLKSTKVP